MELNEFASNYPEYYSMLNENVKYLIRSNNMTGAESLRDWDNMVDDILRNCDQDNYNNEYDMWSVQYQQMPFGNFRDRDRDRDRDRFRRFNQRDIIRLLFLRNLFDRDRRHDRR